MTWRQNKITLVAYTVIAVTAIALPLLLYRPGMFVREEFVTDGTGRQYLALRYGTEEFTKRVGSLKLSSADALKAYREHQMRIGAQGRPQFLFIIEDDYFIRVSRIPLVIDMSGYLVDSETGEVSEKRFHTRLPAGNGSLPL